MAGMSTRSTKFSPAVLSQIASLVQQGMSPAEIAERIGCKVSSLRVRCSQHGISLRRRNGSLASTTKPKCHVRLTILLLEATAEALQRRGKKIGISRTRFAATLIEHIVQDDLYAAVLDIDSTQPHHHTARRGP
jgi:transposase-like protein